MSVGLGNSALLVKCFILHNNNKITAVWNVYYLPNTSMNHCDENNFWLALYYRDQCGHTVDLSCFQTPWLHVFFSMLACLFVYK